MNSFLPLTMSHRKDSRTQAAAWLYGVRGDRLAAQGVTQGVTKPVANGFGGIAAKSGVVGVAR